MTNLELFTKFLKDKNVHDIYMTEFKAQTPDIEWEDYMLNNLYPPNDPEVYLMGSFCWAETEQEHFYWMELAIEWQEYLDQQHATSE